MLDRKSEAAKITKKYLSGKTMDEFAKSLGIGSSKQAVFNWLNAKYAPDTLTALQVITSPESTQDARDWAGEILRLYTADPKRQQA